MSGGRGGPRFTAAGYPLADDRVRLAVAVLWVVVFVVATAVTI